MKAFSIYKRILSKKGHCVNRSTLPQVHAAMGRSLNQKDVQSIPITSCRNGINHKICRYFAVNAEAMRQGQNHSVVD